MPVSARQKQWRSPLGGEAWLEACVIACGFTQGLPLKQILL